MKKINVKLKFMFILSITLLLILSYNSFSQGRLVWFGNAWNYNIIEVELRQQSFSLGQSVNINVLVKCLESTDNTGYIRIVLDVRGPYGSDFQDYKDLNLVPAGQTARARFNFTPQAVGSYNIITEVKGGGYYAWSFDRYSTLITVSSMSSNNISPSGLKIRQPINNGRFTTFIFELTPSAVNKASRDYNYARELVGYMTFVMASDRFGLSSPDPLMSGVLDGTIAIRTNDLIQQSKRHQNESLQVQYTCDDAVLPYLELMRAVEKLVSTGRVLTGFSKRFDTPLIDINIFVNRNIQNAF